MTERCACYDTLVVKNLNRWFKEKWVDVSRKDPKTGKHPPCGRSKAKTSSKGYPKCRPSVKVSDKTPKTSGQMTSGEKQAATKRKRAKKQGVGGKPTVVKQAYPENQADYPPSLVSVSNMLGTDAPQTCTVPGCNNPVSPVVQARYANPLRSIDYTHYMCPEHADMYDFQSMYQRSEPMDLAWRLLKLEDLEDAPRPFAEFSHAELEHFQTYQDNLTPEGREALFRELQLRTKENPPLELPEHMHYDAAGDDESHPMHGLAQLDYTEFSPEFQDKLTGEPMDIAMRLLKTPVSPEAKRHKIEYDKKYESSPERVKYREELNAERRKRGIYGQGGPDMSHTKRHTLVAESPHANRARHFKSRGTLK